MEIMTHQLAGEANPTYYYRGGSGTPVLYLHHLAGMQGWEPVCADLARNFDVLAPYAPGFGPTGEGLEDFDSGLDLVLHFSQLLDDLGLRKVHLVGHSFGGWLAAELAAIQPHRVDRVVLVNPVGLWDESVQGEDPYAQPPMSATAVLFADPASRTHFFLKDGAADPTEAYVQEMRDLKASAKFLWPLPDTGVARRFRFIKAPTLIVTCGMDRVVPEAYGRLWHDGIEESSVVSIPDAGHLVNLEQPERMASIARHFLSGAE